MSESPSSDPPAPGHVAASSAVGPPPGMRIRLSSNESAWGPSPRAVEAATRALEVGHLYPDDQSAELRRALAAHEGVSEDEVAVGHGSAAVLMDLIQQTCADGGDVLAFEWSFVVYRLGARNAGARYVEAPTGGPARLDQPGWQRDPHALLGALTGTTRIVLVDNPGNPTGAHLDADALRTLVQGVPEDVVVVIDEAYHHFATGHDGYLPVADLGLDHPGLVVLRTFSKAFGLAGMRVGYAVGRPDPIAALDAWRTRFNVTAPSQAAAVAALDDHPHLERTVDGTVAGRDRMQSWLRDHDIAFTPSLGNFVTIELGRDASPVVEAFAAHDVGVRPLTPYGMHEQIRVSVGTPDEVTGFLDAAEQVLLP